MGNFNTPVGFKEEKRAKLHALSVHLPCSTRATYKRKQLMIGFFPFFLFWCACYLHLFHLISFVEVLFFSFEIDGVQIVKQNSSPWIGSVCLWSQKHRTFFASTSAKTRCRPWGHGISSLCSTYLILFVVPSAGVYSLYN